MTHQFSLAYLTVPGVTPAAQTRIAARAGYDSVSFRLANIGLPDEPEDPTSPAALRETARALRETGLPVLDVELARIVRDRDARFYLPAMEAAASMGARHMISSAWTTDQDDDAFIIERYAELCELAQPFGLTIDLEFPTFSRLRNLADAMAVVRASGRPNGGILVDALYYHFSGCTPADLASLPPRWVHFIHLCDTGRTANGADDETGPDTGRPREPPLCRRRLHRPRRAGGRVAGCPPVDRAAECPPKRRTGS
jgi:sugar phosphate isomerase/epimerase